MEWAYSGNTRIASVAGDDHESWNYHQLSRNDTGFVIRCSQKHSQVELLSVINDR
jgi:hypothetical protein